MNTSNQFSIEIKRRAVTFIMKLMKHNPEYKRQSDIATLLECPQSNVSRFLASPTQFSMPMLELLTQKIPDAKGFIFDNISDSNNRPAKPLNDVYHDPNGKQIPALDTDVYGTVTPSLSDVITLRPSTFITIPMFSQGEIAVQVTGNSMKGYINHGDWVIVKEIKERRSLIYGEAYLIVTKADNIKTVKFLKPDDDDDENIMLVPYNIEQFEPHAIPKSDVHAYYRIIGLFRTV